MLCNSWNKSVRLMFDVPLSTRALRRNETVEIHTNQEIFQLHLTNLKFSESSSQYPITNYKKRLQIYTGSNLRNILLMTTKDDISELVPSDIHEMLYIPVAKHEEWRIEMVKELIDVKYGESVIENLSNTEIEELLEDICTT